MWELAWALVGAQLVLCIGLVKIIWLFPDHIFVSSDLMFEISDLDTAQMWDSTVTWRGKIFCHMSHSYGFETVMVPCYILAGKTSFDQPTNQTDKPLNCCLTSFWVSDYNHSVQVRPIWTHLFHWKMWNLLNKILGFGGVCGTETKLSMIWSVYLLALCLNWLFVIYYY